MRVQSEEVQGKVVQGEGCGMRGRGGFDGGYGRVWR